MSIGKLTQGVFSPIQRWRARIIPVSGLHNVLPLTVFLLVLGCGVYLVEQNKAIHASENQRSVQQTLAAQASELSRRLSYTLTSTYLLAQEVARSQGEVEHFDEVAASLIHRMEGVTNLQLAPNGIITRIHPLAGNEKAIGHNVLKDDNRRSEAFEAIRDRKLTLAGPFELLQGGTAVIGRNPVFLQQPDGSQKFWGFTSALILLDDLVSGSGLSGLSSSGYAYELSRVVPETGLQSIFAADGDTTNIELQTADIPVPNGNWTLRIGSVANPHPVSHQLGQVGSFLIALLLMFFTRRMVDEPEKLRLKVAAQTHDLHRLAYFDALTGLPNRRQFNDLLSAGQSQCAAATDTGLALLVLDLDHFKEVNDTLGHSKGDSLLREAGIRISNILPNGASLARLGGDEFTVIVVGQKFASVADQISQDITRVIGQPFNLEGNVANISASIGIASVSEFNMEPEDLFQCADRAMYEVKRNGRGGSIHYSEIIQQQIVLRATLIDDLRDAISSEGLHLHYQPIVSAHSGSVDKAEALIRWNHPTRGAICPSVFIPLAEESGMIHELGNWVFNEAVRQAASWRNTHNERFQISINVSPMQFCSDGLISQWIENANTGKFAASSVLIEITEGLLLDNNGSNVELLKAMKAAGMQIAIDDFGTGYSSLSYLKKFDIDYVKIDREFVNNISTEKEDLVLCRAILSIAEGMGFDVVAEGVENTEQQDLLRSLGCQHLQGYLYSKPIAADDFEQQFLDSQASNVVFKKAA